MDHDPTCPVCEARDWQPLESKTYQRSDMARQASYLRRQYTVLFQAWFPGSDSVSITSVLCRRCGFVCFVPRPSEDDVARKYRLVEELGQHSRVSEPDNALDTRRADRMYGDVSALVSRTATVLDYGGGDGRLLAPFVRRGHACYLLDYVSGTVPGVKRLGATVDELEPGRLFDVVILSHVLEHVARPRELVSALREHHSPGGILFVEVPMQLWRRVPPRGEPVTHVNFFAPASLRYLLAASGYEVLSCRLAWHYTQTAALAVRAMARRADQAVLPSLEGAAAYSIAMMKSSPAAAMRVAAVGPVRAARAVASVWSRRIGRRLRSGAARGSGG